MNIVSVDRFFEIITLTMNFHHQEDHQGCIDQVLWVNLAHNDHMVHYPPYFGPCEATQAIGVTIPISRTY